MKQKGSAAVVIIILLVVIIGYLFFSGTVSFSDGNLSFNQENLINPKLGISLSGSCGSPESTVNSFIEGIKTCNYGTFMSCALSSSKYAVDVSDEFNKERQENFKLDFCVEEIQEDFKTMQVCKVDEEVGYEDLLLKDMYLYPILEEYSDVVVAGQSRAYIDSAQSCESGGSGPGLDVRLIKIEGKWYFPDL